MARKHPYLGKPDYQFWKNEPGIREAELFDPVTSVSFQLEAQDTIVTAGSAGIQASFKEHLVLLEALDKDVIDESPAAYKDIGAVMAAQSDLVTIRHRLRQVVNVKG